ncbi:MAG: flagellar hook-basal body complex protein FliE [Candidatus Gastranaerophilales bacterium]|nr:flagellar hook-basal body complex protein FliE [Candidatus Gastranaerophilales bacterium]
MQQGFTPRIQLNAGISDTKLNIFDQPMRMDSIKEVNATPGFNDVMTGLIKNLDTTVKAPDQVLQNAMVGNNADVHDVMIAISKAEIGINLATQVTTKVVQAYEKVMSIQV